MRKIRYKHAQKESKKMLYNSLIVWSMLHVSTKFVFKIYNMQLYTQMQL